MNCDLLQKSERYGACPRTFLKDVIKRAADRGIRVQAAFEDEVPPGRIPRPAVGAGRRQRHLPRDRLHYQGTFHTTMVRTLRSMGMMPEMVHHEGGPGQQEISIHHEHALKAADNQMKLRNAVRGVAHHGLPRQLCAQAVPLTFGNGAHVHMSIWDMETNKNLMYDAGAEEQFSQMGRYFIGGLLTHMPALVALTAPATILPPAAAALLVHLGRGLGLRQPPGRGARRLAVLGPRDGDLQHRDRRRTPPPTRTSRSPA